MLKLVGVSLLPNARILAESANNTKKLQLIDERNSLCWWLNFTEKKDYNESWGRTLWAKEKGNVNGRLWRRKRRTLTAVDMESSTERHQNQILANDFSEGVQTLPKRKDSSKADWGSFGSWPSGALRAEFLPTRHANLINASSLIQLAMHNWRLDQTSTGWCKLW